MDDPLAEKALSRVDGLGKVVELLRSRIENAEVAVRGLEQAMARLLKRAEIAEAGLAELRDAVARYEARLADLEAQAESTHDLSPDDVRGIVVAELKARRLVLSLALE